MLKHLMVSAILLVMAGSMSAKLKVKVAVDISDEKIRSELQEAIEARLNSTERYTVTTNALNTQLLLSVNCIRLERESGVKTGVVCDSDVTYYPYENTALSTEVVAADGLAVGGPNDISFIANSLMNHFINATTDEELEKRKAVLHTSIVRFCLLRPTDCKLAQ